MHPRISNLPSTTPDMDFLDLRQGLIVALGRLAAAYDRRWHQRRRVLDTLPVILFMFALVCARRQGDTTTLATVGAQCRSLDAALPQPVSDAIWSKARPQLDENGFKPFRAEISRRNGQPGAQGLPSCRSTWIPARTLAALADHPEGRLPRQRGCGCANLEHACDWIGAGRCQRHPNRSCRRHSKRPVSKWDRRSPSATLQARCRHHGKAI